MSFKTPYFCLTATSSNSHKHDLLCSTRWLENTNIPSGLYLFLWIIPILFTLISSLLWWINYWHFWCSIFLLICSSFFHFPQLTTQFHYHLCVLSFTLILQLLNAPVLSCDVDLSETHYQIVFQFLIMIHPLNYSIVYPFSLD